MPAGRLRVLLTGFEPFGGEPVNPSQVLVTGLAREAEAVPGLGLSAVILPVDRRELAGALGSAIARLHPEVVVCVGQATGRALVDLESVARNRLDFRGERDNGGHAAVDEPLVADGPDRLASTLPLAWLASQLAGRGLPVALSSDAGRHLCNAALYTLLHRHADVPAAFVHVPLLPEQAERRGLGEPSLPLEISRSCLLALLGLIPAAVDPRPPGGRPG